ncbi:MAG TPA: hypothetical protein VM689_13355 [Aliidongia sp.]|nr:hypothetical protein [Aliidongia sp.]
MASERDRAAKAEMKKLEQRARFQALLITIFIAVGTSATTGWHWSWGYLPISLVVYCFAYSASRSGLLKDEERKLKETAVMRAKASSRA